MRAPNKRPYPNAKFSPGFRHADDPAAYSRAYIKWWVPEQLRLLRLQRGNACQTCGNKTDLQFAHVKPTQLSGRGRGQARRMQDIKSHPSHYILLCKACHMEMDIASSMWCTRTNQRGLKG